MYILPVPDPVLAYIIIIHHHHHDYQIGSSRKWVRQDDALQRRCIASCGAASIDDEIFKVE
jgi:hypothetical protein